MSTPTPTHEFRERLIPGPGLLVTLLLILPAVGLILTPVAPAFALPVAVGFYLLITAALILMSPVITVQGGVLTAGRARIPVAQLGETVSLDPVTLRAAIGPDLDARSYLLVRGYIHTGVRIAVADPADPAPYWIITTRKPLALIAALDAARV
ncbi:MAG: DUF3093 domain-containing protein [Leucobacter sp.]|nr:DUF3093 domain-containing protein [Leucobacter sp.]